MAVIRTDNRIFIEAQADVVYALAADITRWPELLSHYRYVQVVENGAGDGVTRRVKMSAYRSGIPVTWTAVQECRPSENQILYRHVAGVTKGMEVIWQIVPEEGGVGVTIEHELDSPRRWLRTSLAAYVTGRLFVEHIASRTLLGIKRHAEDRSAGQPAR